MIKDWLLTETNLNRIRNRKYEVAVIPTGAIEAHNRHLPQGQDFRHTTYIAEKSCELAFEKSPSVICLPAIPYGVDCNLLDYPLTIHVCQATVDAMLRDIIKSLRTHGIQKIVILNGHGGNDFSPFIRQIQCDLDVFVFCCDWWKIGLDQYEQIFDNPDDHAGEFETSVALALFPDHVKLENAGDGKTKPFRFDALNKGWIKTSRNFAKLNDHCAAGDPSKANAEKGQKYIDLATQRISSFLTELAQSTIDESFPMTP
jgi:creatinine amidohydrolase